MLIKTKKMIKKYMVNKNNFYTIILILALSACTTTPATPPTINPSPVVSVAPSPTQQAIDKSDWKTYSGSKYSIRYPSDWSLTVTQKYLYISNPKGIEQRPRNGGGSYPYQTQFISISTVSSVLTPNEFVDNFIANNQPYSLMDPENITRSSVTHGGKPVEIIKEVGEGDAGGYDMYISNDKELILINTSAKTIDGPSIDSQIVGTLSIK